MICHCGKPVWEYDAATYTCKDGHRTPVNGVEVARVATPVEVTPPLTVTGPRRLFPPAVTGALSGAGTSALLFLLEHLF